MSGCAAGGSETPRFGVHVSIQGSISEAPRRAADLGCECFQIFAGPPRDWRHKTPSPGEIERFRSVVKELGLAPVVVHAGYLIHLVSEKKHVARGSARLFRQELETAAAIGADYYVIHPGSTHGRDRSETLGDLVGVIVDSMSDLGVGAPTVLIENTASARTGLCARFDHVGELLRMLEARGGKGVRFGACFDTAHALAAGYDMDTPESAQRTLKRLFRAVGRSRVKLVHLNDSRSPVGSNRDLHEHVGRGHVGRKGFREILSDRTMWRLPFILETPVDRPGDERRNLGAIRRIAEQAGGERG